MQPLRTISLWMDQLDEPLCARPALRQDLDLDVCIIGAGYTGLWTAYYLKRQAPQLNIAVIEANIAGFGASGRNGGWLMGNLLGEDRLLATLSPQQRRESIDLLHGIPDEVHDVLLREGIACDYRKGGVLYCAARYPEQERSLRAWLDDLYRQGMNEDDYRWLRPEQLDAQLKVSNPYGALYSPHVATIQPARLVRGLARTVEAMGVPIYENTPAIDWQTGEVRTPLARIRSHWVVPAVEGYAASLPPLGRHQLPVQSLLVATEPLPESTWEQIGLSQGQAFSENSRQVTYGQRSADNRLVFGARGGYRFGGRLREDFILTTERGGTAPLPVRRTVPTAQARTHHPLLGRQPRHGPALPPAHALRPPARHRPGRRLWRRGCRRHQPRWTHPGRADPWPTQRTDRAALGARQPPAVEPGQLATRAVPLAGLQRDHPEFRPRGPDPRQPRQRALAATPGQWAGRLHGRLHALTSPHHHTGSTGHEHHPVQTHRQRHPGQ